MTPTKLLLGQIAIVFALVVGGVWAATQWAAAMLGYQARLGPAWFELAVLYAEREKTLRRVACVLADPQRSFIDTLAGMLATNHLGSAEGPQVHPVVAESARKLLSKSENERSDVLSTALSYLVLYRDPGSPRWPRMTWLGLTSASAASATPFRDRWHPLRRPGAQARAESVHGEARRLDDLRQRHVREHAVAHAGKDQAIRLLGPQLARAFQDRAGCGDRVTVCASPVLRIMAAGRRHSFASTM